MSSLSSNVNDISVDVISENDPQENQLVRTFPPSRSFFEMDIYDLDRIVFKSHYTSLIEDPLLFISKQNISPDFAVPIGNHVVHVHYHVMFKYSVLFKRQKERICDWKMPASGLTVKGFRNMYQWMLTDKGLIKREDFIEVMLAAKIFEVSDLLCRLWMLMEHPTLFIEHLALIAYDEARRSTPLLKDLECVLINRIRYVFLSFVAHNEFLKLRFDEVVMFLKSSYAAVNCELEILYSAVRWLNALWEKRAEHLIEMISVIRFEILTAEEVSTFLFDDAIEVKRVLLSIDLQEKLQFSLVHKMMSQSFTQLPGSSDIDSDSESAPRGWIHDRLCSYHHKPACFQKLRYTYHNFKEYLKLLSEKELDHWRTFITKDTDEACCQNARCLQLLEFQITANSETN